MDIEGNAYVHESREKKRKKLSKIGSQHMERKNGAIICGHNMTESFGCVKTVS